MAASNTVGHLGHSEGEDTILTAESVKTSGLTCAITHVVSPHWRLHIHLVRHLALGNRAAHMLRVRHGDIHHILRHRR
jgi:hypothetical protein